MFTPGPTVEFILVSGIKIKCMVKEYTLGPMVDLILVIISMIRNKDMVLISGLIIKNSKETGKTVNNTEKEFSLILKVKQEKALGRRANEKIG